MRFGWPISVLLHLTFVGVSLVAFSSSVETYTDSRVIPIDIVTVSDATNIRAAIRSPDPKPPSQEPMQVETPMENAPEVGQASTRTTLDIQTAETVTPVPGGDRQINVPDEKENPESFNLDNLSVLVDRTRATQAEANQQIAPQSEQAFYDFAASSRRSTGLGTELTASEVDALRSAMYQCWRIPLDAKNPEELVVSVRVRLRGDGAVEAVALDDPGAVNRSANPFMTVAAQRAVAAVSKCAPYDFLPLEKYDTWKEMVLRFKPEI